MKIAISSTGEGMDSDVDVRFGRCPYFVVVEIEDGKVKKEESFQNESAAAMGGAGLTSAQFVAEKGVKAIISGNVGPRAFQVFSQFGIEVYTGTGKVKYVVDQFIKGELKKVGEATGPMFQGMPGGRPGAGQGAGQGAGKGAGQGAGRRGQ